MAPVRGLAALLGLLLTRRLLPGALLGLFGPGLGLLGLGPAGFFPLPLAARLCALAALAAPAAALLLFALDGYAAALF